MVIMTSTSHTHSTFGDFSHQTSSSTTIGSMFNQFISITMPNNPQNMINNIGIFQCEVDVDATP
jgi:hypothetical protein